MTSARQAGSGLPRADSLTDALVAPALDRVSADELSGVRQSLVSQLVSLAASADLRLPTQIGSYEFVTALDGPEHRKTGAHEPFVISPARCRRAIGLAAVQRCARGHSDSARRAVSEILRGALEDVTVAQREAGSPRPAWWAEWYASLPPGGQAVVEAEALTWATQLWSALDWSRFDRPPVLVGRDDSWRCPGPSGLLLRGRADVRVLCEERQSFLLLGGGFPRASWRLRLAYPALVAALAVGDRGVPARVIGLWPASGLVRTCEVDRAALADAAAALVVAAKVHAKPSSREVLGRISRRSTLVRKEAV